MSSLSSSFKSIEGMPAITPTPVYSNILVGQPPVYVQCTGLTDLTDGESSQYCYNGTVFQQTGGDNVYLRLKLDDTNTVLYPVVGQSVIGQQQDPNLLQQQQQQVTGQQQSQQTLQQQRQQTPQQVTQPQQAVTLALSAPIVTTTQLQQQQQQGGEESVVVTAVAQPATTVTTQLNECVYCRVSFASEIELRQHMEVAHNARRFQCNICGKSYTKAFLLKNHIKSRHDNIRDIFCPTCQKAFSKRSVMKRHMKSVHADSKDYTCSMCNKAFAEKKNLQMHINALHKGLKPFHCQVCGKDFARKCDLLRHGNSVHKESKPFECSSCGKGFPQRWYLERHMVAVHKMTLQQMPQMPTTTTNVFTMAQAPQATTATILTQDQLMQQLQQQQQIIQTQQVPQHQVIQQTQQQQHAQHQGQQLIQTAGQQQGQPTIIQHPQIIQQQTQQQQDQQQQHQQVQQMQQLNTQQQQTAVSQNQVMTQIVQPQFSQAQQQQLQFSAFSQAPTNSVSIVAAGGTRFAMPMPAGPAVSGTGAPLSSTPHMVPTFFFQQAGGGGTLIPSTPQQLQLAAAAAAAAQQQGGGAIQQHNQQQAGQQQRIQVATGQQITATTGLPPAQHMLQQGATTISIINPTTQTVTAAQIQTQQHPPAQKQKKQYACNQCDKVYPRNQSLQAHIIQVHSDVRPFTCRICRKGFVRRWDFYRHINAVHRDRAREALDEDKVEEYVAWMRSRVPTTDISWECLNAVREECPATSAAPLTAAAGGVSTSVVNVVATTTPTAPVNQITAKPSGSPTAQQQPPTPSGGPANTVASTPTNSGNVTVTMIKPADE